MESDEAKSNVSHPGNKVVRFGEFSFEFAKNILFKKGKVIALPPKSCELLGIFLQNPERILSKVEIMDAVWSGVYVEESNLSHHIAVLRKALGEIKSEKAFIETIPRKGYRFVAPVFVEIEEVRLNGDFDPIGSTALRDDRETLIGREETLAEIREILDGEEFSVLTLTGTGGTGKTSLAINIADTCREESDSECYFVDLSAVRRPELVVSAIANALEINEKGQEDRCEELAAFIGNRTTLLILDNFEQVLPAKSEVSELVAKCSNLRVLITSRSRTNIKGEIEFRVPTLSVPVEGSEKWEIFDSASVRLFSRRAKLAKRGFELTDKNASDIAEICRQLDGLPLAIELAAPRVRLMSPAEILKRLSHKLSFLTSKGSDLPERHQTISASIEWSYDLLDAIEQSFFKSLAVFVDGFTLDAVEAVFPQTGETHSVLDLLDALLDNNLLNATDQDDESVRFRFLEPIREFALEKGLEDANWARLLKRHADYFRLLARDLETKRRDGGGMSELIFRKFKAETNELAASVTYLIENEPQAALEMAADLNVFWLYNSQFSEGRRFLQTVLAKAPESPSVPRAIVCKGLAMLAWKQGDLEESEMYYNECFRIGDKLKDREVSLIARNGLGTLAYLQGRNGEARAIYEELLPIARELKDTNLLTSILANLGEIARIEEEFEIAIRYNEEVLELAKSVNNTPLICGSNLNIAASLFSLGQLAEAEKQYKAAMSLAEDPSRKPFLSICLDGEAAIEFRRGNSENAVQLAQKAERLRSEIGYKLELPDELFRKKFVDCFMIEVA